MIDFDADGYLDLFFAGGGSIDGAKFGGSDREVASLKTTENFTDEATFDGIGLANDKRAIHFANARPTDMRDAIRLG